MHLPAMRRTKTYKHRHITYQSIITSLIIQRDTEKKDKTYRASTRKVYLRSGRKKGVPQLNIDIGEEHIWKTIRERGSNQGNSFHPPIS